VDQFELQDLGLANFKRTKLSYPTRRASKFRAQLAAAALSQFAQEAHWHGYTWRSNLLQSWNTSNPSSRAVKRSRPPGRHARADPKSATITSSVASASRRSRCARFAKRSQLLPRRAPVLVYPGHDVPRTVELGGVGALDDSDLDRACTAAECSLASALSRESLHDQSVDSGVDAGGLKRWA